MNLKKCCLGLILGLGLVVASQTNAFADDISTYRESIRSYQTRMDALKVEGASKYSKEMSSISEWIEQSLILIGKNETSQVKSLVTKAGVYLDYVESGVKKDKAITDALTAESQLKALKAEYGKLDAEVQQLEAEEALLTKQYEALSKK